MLRAVVRLINIFNLHMIGRSKMHEIVLKMTSSEMSSDVTLYCITKKIKKKYTTNI